MIDKENQRSYNLQYQKEKIKHYAFNLNVEHDSQLIEWMEGHRPYGKYFRELIREDMIAHGVDAPEKVDGRLKTGEFIGWRDKIKKD